MKYQNNQYNKITLRIKWELTKWGHLDRNQRATNFAMHSEFRYHSEKLCITIIEKTVHREILQGLRNFRYGSEIFAILAKFSLCHSENPDVHHSFLHQFSLHFFISHFTFLHPGLMKSPRIHKFQHQYEAQLEMMAEVPKTCKTTKSNLKTKSVVLIRPAHINRLNSYD